MPKLICCLISCQLIFLQVLPAYSCEAGNTAGQVIFFDSKEGDAILLQSKGLSVLIDSGNLLNGSKLTNELKKLGVFAFDRIILTHPHLDHIGGVFNIANEFNFKFIHDNNQDLSKHVKDDVYRWYVDLVRKHKKYKPLIYDETFTVGHFAFKVISPAGNLKSKDWNTNSLVLLVANSADSFRLLLMGDANLATEANLIRSGADLRADILKAGHHGAIDASSESFIKKVKPKLSVVSVNQNNIRGYPSPKVIKRLKKYSQVLQTKDNGSIRIEVCNDGTYKTETEK